MPPEEAQVLTDRARSTAESGPFVPFKVGGSRESERRRRRTVQGRVGRFREWFLGESVSFREWPDKLLGGKVLGGKKLLWQFLISYPHFRILVDGLETWDLRQWRG